VRVSPFANPGLASGGTGDVLTGMLGGLMAQGLSPYRAACCGVYIHGQAAASVTRRKGNTGTIASDLIEELPATINRLRRQLETVEGFA
jgi:NAD(P)H-hydrate repair Nnr-like enzyme with NAD(P)H-hydrate dehydratase domain